MLFQFWSMSEDSRAGILLTGSSIRVCLVVLNQGCCDLKVIQPWIKVMYCSSLWLILHIRQSRDQYLPSIHSWDSSPWQVLYCFLFLFCLVLFLTVCGAVLVFFKRVINLTSFLFKSKFISFPICISAHFLS